MLSVIKTLRAIFEKCARGESLTRAEAAWLAAGFAAYLEHRCRSMDEAFGVELGEYHFGGLSTAARCEAIAQLSRRYAAANWPHDALRSDMPERYRDTPLEFMWRAFKSGAPMPLCERQLRNILAPARRPVRASGARSAPPPS